MNKLKFRVINVVGMITITVGIFLFSGLTAYAKEEKIPIEGSVYTIAERNQDFSIANQEPAKDTETKTYGDFFISGNLKEISEENGVPSL